MLTYSAVCIFLLAYAKFAGAFGPRRDYGPLRSGYRHRSFSPYPFSYGPHPGPPKYTESIDDPDPSTFALSTTLISSYEPPSVSAAPTTSFLTGSGHASTSSITTSKVSGRPSLSVSTDPFLGSGPSTTCTEEDPPASYANASSTVSSHDYPSAGSVTGSDPTFTPSKRASLGTADPSASVKPSYFSPSGTRPYPYPNATSAYDPTGSSRKPSYYPTLGTKSYPYPNDTNVYDPTSSSDKPSYYPTATSKLHPYSNTTRVHDPTGSSGTASYHSGSGTGKYSYPNATTIHDPTGPSGKPSYYPTSGTKSYTFPNLSIINDPTGSSGKPLSTGYHPTNPTSHSVTVGDPTATSWFPHPTASSSSPILSVNATSRGDPSSGLATSSDDPSSKVSASRSPTDPGTIPSFPIVVTFPVTIVPSTHSAPGKDDPSPTKLPPKPTTSSAKGYGHGYGHGYGNSYDFNTVRYERT